MLTPAIVSHSTVPGGAEAYLTRLYRTFAQDGHSPIMVGGIPTWDDAGLDRIPLTLSPKWGGKTMATGLLKLSGERRKLKEAIEDLSPDYFHVQYKREQIGFTDLLARRAPVVWTEHGRFLRGPKGALLAAGYREAAKRVAVIICVSADVADDVRRVVGPGPRIEVIENAVDTSALQPASDVEKVAARESLGIPDGLPVLLWIGRLAESKRPRFAVQLAAAWPGVTLIAGDGPLHSAVVQDASSVTGVRVLGHVSDTGRLYRASDVMAFTSTGASEGYPTTTMVESAAHGVPIVTDGQSGALSAVSASGGFVLPSDATAKDWAEALLESISPERSAAVRRWAVEHDVRAWAQKHEDIVRSVL
ncbi:glycosyltransferase family 4 protein [Pseudarthrobacter polychromogenes]|nr:glycosyltransferase family 4 protein [Pseudarthrobacter polychromogenes]